MSTTSPSPGPDQSEKPHRPRVTGEERARLRKAVADDYRAKGASIRAVADKHGLSYGLTRQLLQEARVQMRPRHRPLKTAQ